MICHQLPLLVFTLFVVSEGINGVLSDGAPCSVKFDSMYEDACLRGNRMKNEAKIHGYQSLNGVTCDESCSDIYKSDIKLAAACKYGCNTELAVEEQKTPENLFDRLHRAIANVFHKQHAWFSALHTDSSGKIQHQDQEKSDDNTHGLVSRIRMFFSPDPVGKLQHQDQKSDDNTHSFVRHIRIFIPFNHPELAKVERTTQTLDDSESPFEKMKRMLRFPFLFGMGANDQTTERNDQQIPHHDKKPLSWALMSSKHHEKNVQSVSDRFFSLLYRVNPIIILLVLVLIFIFILSVFNLCIYFCRRRTRHTYTYTLPTGVEEVLPYYPTDFDGKKIVEEKADEPKDVKETVGA